MKLTQKLLITYFRSKLRVLSVLSTRKAAASAFDLFCTPLRKSKRKVPACFAHAEPFSLTIDKYVISGHRWPKTGAKKILIIHGFESSSRNFESYINALTAEGFEVVVFDAPAHGQSSGSRILLPLYVDTIARINELMGPFDGFIAHSFGGLAAAHFLETVPHDERTRLVLIAPATETVTTVDSFFSFLRLTDKVRETFDQLIQKYSGRPTSYFSVRRAVQHIRAEVLWFHDEEDELTPIADALRVRDLHLPNVTFKISRGLGHRRIYRDPHTVQQVVSFMRSAVTPLLHRHK